jgi:hypothetical protein
MPQTKNAGVSGYICNLKSRISSLLNAVTMMCWTFYDISTQGYFILGENRLVVRYFECGLVGFSVIYVLFLLVAFVKKKTDA